jgi:hypothetical protein
MLRQLRNAAFYLILDQVAEECLFPRLYEHHFLYRRGLCVCSIRERKNPLSAYFMRMPMSSQSGHSGIAALSEAVSSFLFGPAEMIQTGCPGVAKLFAFVI